LSDSKDFDFPHAIEQVTSRPARFLNLNGRGVIEEGYIADLAIVGRDDFGVRDVILGGKLYGDKKLPGAILMHRK